VCRKKCCLRESSDGINIGFPQAKAIKKEVGVAKVAITCNGAKAENIFPTFVLGSAATACGDDVILFFEPASAPALVKGKLENMEAKGMPDLKELVESFQILGGRILLCELGLGANDIKEEDLRDGVEIVGATTFLSEIRDVKMTFSF
jgi:predicted peroxiredoxin